ncbi:hypothetical protein LZ554_003476 [Drepanopeziza brunnea f. sp. 'monogermtubi']|nr:hypothetical protein LZ554_003476 [Drepanopeziza brunnea f. sp. 'monogermtubi']
MGVYEAINVPGSDMPGNEHTSTSYVSLALGSLDADALIKKHFGNDSAWFQDRIPLFESSSSVIDDVYYYRWNVFRTHQRDLGPKGFISTEFLDNVGWQTNPWASLNDATGFHLREGRWCRDLRFKREYANFIFSSDSNTHQFSEVMADSVWQSYLVDGIVDDATPLLDEMQAVFAAWNGSFDFGNFDTSEGLYWIQPLTDATEYTIASIDASGGQDGFRGGEAFRPTINSYQYANALAIANIAELQGDASLASAFRYQATAIKARVQESLWNSTLEHFIDRYQVSNEYVKYWDPIRGRELAGYVPWLHNLPDDKAQYGKTWSHLTNTSGFQGQKGLRTNEPSYEFYMRQYRYEGTHPECQWNGPAWPYQTAQVLGALSNLLDHYPSSSSAVSSADYIRILTQYAQLHYNPDRGNILDIEEDYYPDTGSPIVGLARSPHYFHSSFVDLILSGLVGIRPRADDTLEVHPTIDDTVKYFRAERILYHGHDVAVQWDADGSQYGRQGLIVEVDGQIRASSAKADRLIVENVARQAPPPDFKSPIPVSVQLQASTPWPRGNVSEANPDAAKVHSAIDGRVWFFPEKPHGWDTPAGAGAEMWFQIEFEAATRTSRAEIAFYQDSAAAAGFDVPESYRVQVHSGEKWTDVSGAKYSNAVANGITDALWTEAETKMIRLVFTPKSGRKVRLVEFKVFS